MKAMDAETQAGSLRTKAEQLVVTQMDEDISRRAGVRTIQQRVAHEHGIHLSRLDIWQPSWTDTFAY